MKIVVIGGSGFIGSKLVPKLRQRGDETVAASPHCGVNSSTFPNDFLRLLAKFQASDLPTTLAKRFFDNLLVDHKELAFYHRH